MGAPISLQWRFDVGAGLMHGSAITCTGTKKTYKRAASVGWRKGMQGHKTVGGFKHQNAQSARERSITWSAISVHNFRHLSGVG